MPERNNHARAHRPAAVRGERYANFRARQSGCFDLQKHRLVYNDAKLKLRVATGIRNHDAGASV